MDNNNQKMKICKNCNAPIYASTKVCPYCQAKCKGSVGKVIFTFVIILVIVIVISAVSSINNERKEAIEKIENFSSELTEYSNEVENVDSTQEDEPTKPSQKEDGSSDKGIRPEFKKAMDNYEEFYNEYLKFMEKYQKNPTDFKLLSDYADMISKAEEMDKNFEKWNNDELSDEELKYYFDVQNRISKKLVDSVQ